jgi:hypothetical protein
MAVEPSTEAKNQYQDDDEYQHCWSSFLRRIANWLYEQAEANSPNQG